MGGESSKPETIVKTVYVESDESKAQLRELEKQLEQLKKDAQEADVLHKLENQLKQSKEELQLSKLMKQIERLKKDAQKANVLSKLENQLEELKKEVTSMEPSIQQDVKNTIYQEEDALLVRYSQLKDKAKIEEDIKKIFGNFPLLDFIVDTACRMVTAMTSSEEMTEVLRWQERKIVKRIGDQVYGIEAHYKVKMLEETKGEYMGLKTSKETVVLIAYKCLAHVMELKPEEYPDAESFKKITF